jgi:hypothetical protein
MSITIKILDPIMGGIYIYIYILISTSLIKSNWTEYESTRGIHGHD